MATGIERSAEHRTTREHPVRHASTAAMTCTRISSPAGVES